MIFPNSDLPPLVTINSYSQESVGSQNLTLNGNGWSSMLNQAWPTANKAIFIPFTVFKPINVVKMFVFNGTVTLSGNVDVGIYDLAGTRIVSSGSTAQAGTNTLQSFDITDTMLGPGVYYMAICFDNTTATMRHVSTGGVERVKTYGVAEATSAFPLPATVTLVTATSDITPFMGLTTRVLL